MLKSIILCSLCLMLVIALPSCGNNENKAETTEEMQETEGVESASTDTLNEVSQKVVFQCPMNCEKGKTYEVMGTCPVCKMDLAVVGDDVHDDHDGHEKEGE